MENDIIYQLRRAAEFALENGFKLSLGPAGVNIYKTYGRGTWQYMLPWEQIEDALGNEIVSVMEREIAR